MNFKKLFSSPKKSAQVFDTIEEIHNSFDIASDNALAEAKRILSSINQTQLEKDNFSKLVEKGFTAHPLVKKILHETEVSQKQKQRALTVEEYRIKYPQYKFIFFDQVTDICKKYGLVCGTAERYKGEIPQKNIDEIYNFKVAENDVYFTKNISDITWKMQHNPEYMKYAVKKGTDTFEIPEGPVYFESWNKVPLFICAPASDMETDQNTTVKNGFLSQSVPDPIVLHFVPEGFLIVSKWGLEGKDAFLTNETMN